MTSTIIYTTLTLSAIGTVAAVILYMVARKFHVHEDPKIDEIDAVLPGANCGGCGYAGCRVFAEACVKAGDFSELYCPVGGNECMEEVAEALGIEAIKRNPEIPVIHCNGTCENRPRTSRFDGASSCAVLLSHYQGETSCSYGCIGQGDCVSKCEFGAMSMNPVTGLPEIDDEKCVSCGVCVRACSKDLISMRKVYPKNRKIYVSCRSEEKGGIAKKSCAVACIGCGKCAKVCPFDAVTIENHLARIDTEKCKLCRKCVDVCPTNAIIEVNFPPRKTVKEETLKVTDSNKESGGEETVDLKVKVDLSTEKEPGNVKDF